MEIWNNYLLSYVQTWPDSKVKEASLYALHTGGKQLRPRLLFEMLKAYNIPENIGYPFASALEMIHTYSLIHDDLPAMDNDALRRGQPTVHIAFGEATAILAGDALLSGAFEILARPYKNTINQLEILELFANYSGAGGMVYGQALEFMDDEKSSQADRLTTIHLNKTGKLLTLPFIVAALLANQKEDVNTLKEVGEKLGLAFQIQDDVLDATSTTKDLGKTTGSDQTNGKYTYIDLLGLESANEYIHQLFLEIEVGLKKVIDDESTIFQFLHEIQCRRK